MPSRLSEDKTSESQTAESRLKDTRMQMSVFRNLSQTKSLPFLNFPFPPTLSSSPIQKLKTACRSPCRALRSLSAKRGAKSKAVGNGDGVPSRRHRELSHGHQHLPSQITPDKDKDGDKEKGYRILAPVPKKSLP